MSTSELIEEARKIIEGAHEGDWAMASEEWRQEAARWRAAEMTRRLQGGEPRVSNALDAASDIAASHVLPLSPAHIALWDAINVYAETCGTKASVRRQRAVVGVECALNDWLAAANRRGDHIAERRDLAGKETTDG